jgi:outer membrane protein assembly factor BamD
VLAFSPALGFGLDGEGDNGRAPKAMLERAVAMESAGKRTVALRTYGAVIKKFPHSAEAPEALMRRGSLFMGQRRHRRAFHCFQRLLDKYPDSSCYVQTIELEYEMAKSIMDGKRSYLFWGKIPGFRDRTAAIDFFKKIIERVPYGEFVPDALMGVAKLSMRGKDPAAAIVALEKLVDEYGNSPLAPEALLFLAEIYRNSVPGKKYDQKMTREAINCYSEFLMAFPDSPLAPMAEQKLAEATDFLAGGIMSIGDFYYNKRQNPMGAKTYYEKAIKLATADSPTAAEAEKRLMAIEAGKRGKGSPLDPILGAYRQKFDSRTE